MYVDGSDLNNLTVLLDIKSAILGSRPLNLTLTKWPNLLILMNDIQLQNDLRSSLFALIQNYNIGIIFSVHIIHIISNGYLVL